MGLHRWQRQRYSTIEYVTGEIRPSIDAHAIVVQNESGRYKIINDQGKTISHLTFSQYQSKYYNL